MIIATNVTLYDPHRVYQSQADIEMAGEARRVAVAANSPSNAPLTTEMIVAKAREHMAATGQTNWDKGWSDFKAKNPSLFDGSTAQAESDPIPPLLPDGAVLESFLDEVRSHQSRHGVPFDQAWSYVKHFGQNKWR